MTAHTNYRRFTDAYATLKDAAEHLDDATEEMSDFEFQARKQLIALCREISHEHSFELEE
jgi:hypothetical protein